MATQRTAAEEAKANADQDQNATTTRDEVAQATDEAFLDGIAARLRGVQQPDPNAGREWTASTDKQTGVVTARLK